MYKDIVYKPIEIDQFSPKILTSNFFTEGMLHQEGEITKPRYVYNYEFEFIIDSRGKQYIENKKYIIEPGNLLFRRPGEYTYGVFPYSCYCICFDLAGTSSFDNRNRYNFHEVQEFECNYTNELLDHLPTYFEPKNPEKYHDLFKKIFKMFLNLSPTSELLIKAYILQLLHTFSVDAHSSIMDERLKQSKYYKELIGTVSYVDQHLNQRITLQALADHVRISPFHFHKIFTEYMGVTPNKFVTEKKIERAKELLIFTSHPIQNIALECGYDNIQYFSNSFKKHLQLSPSQYRKRYTQL